MCNIKICFVIGYLYLLGLPLNVLCCVRLSGNWTFFFAYNSDTPGPIFTYRVDALYRELIVFSYDDVNELFMNADGSVVVTKQL